MPDFGRFTPQGGDRFAPKAGDPSLNEINRTEKFIEALSLERPGYSTDHQEAELAQLLAAWRDDARRAPSTTIAPTRDAVAALHRGTVHRPRVPLALIGSVAAAVLCLGGFGAAIYGSSPGEALYGLRGTIFGQQQLTRDVHVELASSELEQVQQLIEQGDWERAQDKLQSVSTTVATVGDEKQKQALVDQWQKLSVKVENRDPHATVPPDAPPVVLPEVSPVTSTPVSTIPLTAVPSAPPEPSSSSEVPTSSSESSSTTPSSSGTSAEPTPPSESATSVPGTTPSSASSTPTRTSSTEGSTATSTVPQPSATTPVEVPNPASEAADPAPPVHTGTTVMPTVPGSAATPEATAPHGQPGYHQQEPAVRLPPLPGVITAGPQR